MDRTNNLLNIFNHKLYKYSNKTYLNFIQKILEKNELEKHKITINYLAKTFENKVSNELFLVSSKGEIIFLNSYNLIKFEYSKKCKIHSLLNINIKNQKAYELIKTIEVLQKRFLISNDLKDIKYLNHKQILEKHKELFNNYLSKPLISLIVNNTQYKDKNNNILTLTFLTPGKHFIQYIQIKFILNIYPLADDKVLQKQLKLKFNTTLSTVQISKVRKRYFIANKFKRKDNNYRRFEFYFNKKRELNNENLYEYKEVKAVYELVANFQINYNYKNCNTLYIGSTKNLYKRLNEYINKKGHTQKIKSFLDNNIVYFRIIKTTQYKDLEILLLNDFRDFYGQLPILNTNNN